MRAESGGRFITITTTTPDPAASAPESTGHIALGQARECGVTSEAVEVEVTAGLVDMADNSNRFVGHVWREGELLTASSIEQSGWPPLPCPLRINQPGDRCQPHVR